MRKILFGFLFFIAAFGLAGWLGFTLYSSDTSDAPKRSSDVKVEVTPIDRADSRNSDNVETARDVVEDVTSEPDPVEIPLSYIGWEIRDLGEQSQACLGFSSRLPTGVETDLKNYIEVSPKTPFSVAVSGPDLCVLGLDYAKTYDIAILPGLEAASGAKLEIRREVEVSFGEKPPFIGFAGEGIILPRTQQGALGVKSMNVDAIEAKVYRVNHRILSQMTPNMGNENLEGDYSYGSDGWGKKVEIWSGDIAVDSQTNKMVTTAFELQSHIEDQGPGAYIIELVRKTDETRKHRIASAWRWIIVTDLALTSYRGNDGLTVSVRSIDSAKLQSGIRLDLIAENNDKLGEVVTDAQGRAKFATALLDGNDSSAPKMIMAYNEEGDYAILDMARAPLDLTALDVTGRESRGPIDVFAYTERGVYRPGQTVHLTALIRNDVGDANFDRPIKLIVKKPDSSDAYTETLTSMDKAGGVSFAYDVPNDAPRGQWRLQFDAEGLGVIHNVTFSVEDFVPQKLRLALDAGDGVMRPGTARTIKLDAQFLYGAAGRGLAAEGEARIQIDPKPFPKFDKYSFGDETETYREQFVFLDEGLTREDGTFPLQLDLDPSAYKSSYPLRAFVTGGVAEPGGRFVRDSVFVPVRSQDVYIGMKPGFDSYASRNRPVPISLIAVNAEGKRVQQNVDWTLVEEDYDYHWYRENSRWRYRRDVRDIPITSGTLNISEGAPADWQQRLSWGRYRLDVVTKSGSKASYAFGVGWSRGTAATDAPDRIQIGAPDRPSKPGQKFTITLNSPYAGRGDLVIASESVHQVQAINIPAGASEITLPFGKNWGQSVYAMVTLYTPRDAKNAVPKRAVGLGYIELNNAEKVLNFSLDAPEKARPRQTLPVTVKIDNIPSGQKAFITLAAVDEGILQLTKYKSPDAEQHYFAKKAFALDVRDDYARILDPFAAQGADRQGGDSLGGAGLTVVPTKTVAMYHGIVDVKNGKAVIPLELPDFNGELRLMATAWSKTAVGSMSQPMKVRDPVPANLALPRFLAPGDKAIATVALDNIDGADGDYITKVTALSMAANADPIRFSLNKGQRDQARLPLSSDEIGVDTLSLAITGPGGYSLTSEYPIQTRAPYRDITEFQLSRLAPGERYTLNQTRFKDFVPGSAQYTISAEAIAGLTPAPFLAALRQYPYGCTEQTVSTAMPLVFVDELGGFTNMSQLEQRREVQNAIERLAARQDSEGAFGLWRVGDGNARPWLNLYVTDFMLKADERGFDVQEAVLNKAMSAAEKLTALDRQASLNLNFSSRNESIQTRQRAEAAAYAHYLLVQGGKGKLSAMRYLYDEFGNKMESPLSLAYLAAALDGMGDTRRAASAYDKATILLDNDADEYDYYASDVRDAAAVLAIAGDNAPEKVSANVIKRLAGIKPTSTNTQENAWLVQAMAVLKKSAGDVNVSADGLKLTSNSTAGLAGDLTGKAFIENKSDKPVWISLSVHGTPKSAPEPVTEGFTLTKTLYDMNGKILSSPTLKHGERGVIVIEAKQQTRRSTMVVISDLLPAGFEIEQVLTPADGDRKDGKDGAFEWAGQISEFDLSEARDDRYVASLRTYRWYNSQPIRAAYMVRAVTAGEFAFPGAMIEDMYRPERIASTEVKRLTVSDAGTN